MLLNAVGAANIASKVCAVDAALSRPAELLCAIATTFNGASASVNGTVIVAVVAVGAETAAKAISGNASTREMVPTKFSLASVIHPPTVTGPFADMM